MDTRSRIPTRPWPPSLALKREFSSPRPSSRTSIWTWSRSYRTRTSARRAAACLIVRQPLLHQPIGGQVDAGREGDGLALDLQVHRQPGGAGLSDELVEPVQARPWR